MRTQPSIAFMRLALALCLALASKVSAQELGPIQLHYHERPPYAFTQDDDTVTGMIAAPAEQAMRRAGLAFKWVRTPSNRQIQLLERDTGKNCMVGWFKNPQRQLIGQFSAPLYRDKPTIGLALFSNTKIDSGIALEQSLQDSSLRLLVKDGYSYGDFIDGLIQELKPKKIVTTVENLNMLRMIALDRADYFFIAEEEANELVKAAEFRPTDFKYIHFSNSPSGSQRYLWCSRQLSEATMAAINQAIVELNADSQLDEHTEVLH